MAADGSGLDRLISSPFQDRQARWSPDGKEIVFQRSRKGEAPGLHRLRLDGRTSSEIRAYPARLSDPDWSPDGEYLAFVSDRDGAPNIFLLHLKSGRETRLSQGSRRSLWPRWSPSGDRIVYFSRNATDGLHDDLFIVPIPSSGSTPTARRVTTAEAHEFCPEWSPDGRYLVYAKGGVEDRSLVLLRLKDGSELKLASDFARINGPSWSPDGKTLAFAARREGKSYGIFTLEISLPETP